MPRRRALVDAFRKGPHLRHPLGYFLAQQHAAAAGLGALPDHDLDGVGAPQIVGIHAVARRQILIDQQRGMAALFRRHAAVAGGGAGADRGGAASECFLGSTREGAKTHAGDRHRRPEMNRLFGEARPQHDVGAALLTIAFERIARDRCAEKQQVVEMRKLALGAAAADIVDAGRRGALDLRNRVAVERRRKPRLGSDGRHGHEFSLQ